VVNVPGDLPRGQFDEEHGPFRGLVRGHGFVVREPDLHPERATGVREGHDQASTFLIERTSDFLASALDVQGVSA
jgi:hypothetical protein